MNITQLRQGSLNGLRRQVNECLDNAYNKGYQDGKSDPQKVEASVNEKLLHDEYMRGQAEGYARGKEDGYQDGYDKGLEDGKKQFMDCQGAVNNINAKALEEFENLFVYEKDYEDFFEDTYGTKNPDYNLYDLVAKYGIAKVVADFMKWQEEKKKADEEIKVGDEVIYANEKCIITYIGQTNYDVLYPDGMIGTINKVNNVLQKTGKNVADKLQELFGEVEESED